MQEQVFAALGAGGVASVFVVYLLRNWISERLKESIRAEYTKELEKHKKGLELHLSDQVRLRKVYEDLAFSLEDMFGNMPSQTPQEMGIAVHKMFALLAIYAPDDVYRDVKNVFYAKGTKTTYARDFRPVVYSAIRKSLLGSETQLGPADMVDQMDITPLPAVISPANRIEP